MARMTTVPTEKDSSGQREVATAWRGTLGEVVRAFAAGDYALKRGVPFVEPVSPRAVRQIESYLKEYGETLVELPPETWQTSVSQWMEGYWDVLVDLWTAESGASDLVLSARIFERGAEFRFEIHGVYVP
jgi:hypothetical protein